MAKWIAQFKCLAVLGKRLDAPIQNRIDMLTTGVNAEFGIRVLGQDMHQVVNVSEEIAPTGESDSMCRKGLSRSDPVAKTTPSSWSTTLT